MVDPGEEITVTLKREFAEEAFASEEMSEEDIHKCQQQIEAFFLPLSGHVIYRVRSLLLKIFFFYAQGYVDDPRNTDNAWLETVAVNFHDETGTSVGQFDLKVR
jgi:ADP-ribose pyrophosphatase